MLSQLWRQAWNWKDPYRHLRNRRRALRLPVSLSVEVRLQDQQWNGNLREISAQGARVRLPQRLPDQATVWIRLTQFALLADSHQEVPFRVVRQRAVGRSGWNAGLARLETQESWPTRLRRLLAPGQPELDRRSDRRYLTGVLGSLALPGSDRRTRIVLDNLSHHGGMLQHQESYFAPGQRLRLALGPGRGWRGLSLPIQVIYSRPGQFVLGFRFLSPAPKRFLSLLLHLSRSSRDVACRGPEVNWRSKARLLKGQRRSRRKPPATLSAARRRSLPDARRPMTLPRRVDRCPSLWSARNLPTTRSRRRPRPG